MDSRRQKVCYHNTNVSLIEIFIVCWCLGSLYVVEIWSLFHTRKHARLVVYLLVLQSYFSLEFLNSWWYQPSSVTSQSFLIYGVRGNFAFWMMQCCSVVEYLMVGTGDYCFVGGVSAVGVFVAATGVLIRHLAMRQCGDSFSHYIATEKLHHKLTVDGIYGLSRHPSYLGFWLMTVGIEILLHNAVNLVIDIIALHFFFQQRTRYEEAMLVKFYGDEYKRYQARVGVYIPFI
ncbi:uncharacterized protein LODBEIA_P43450 [Lodderomyces beijingensis]|uniref:Protein-S-isoprenylcysteine O-methyltransferase n=1 Tax=Lodderomyces beijingensis TaxID=1775926 RepID=A0ABP0ZPM9_9ASCO